MKKVINKKILPWLLFGCFSYLPIAAACSSNQATKVVNQQSEKTNQPSGMNGLFGMNNPDDKGQIGNTQSLDNRQQAENNHTNSPIINSQQPLGDNHKDASHLEVNHHENDQKSPSSNNDSSMNQQLNDSDEQDINEQQDAPTQSPQQTDFTDLATLKKQINAEGSIYQALFPTFALSQIQSHTDHLLKLFQKTNNDIDHKYLITITTDHMTFADQVKGEIRDLIARFQFNDQYQDVRFSLVGLKQQIISEQLKKEHQQFLVKKTHLAPQLQGLFPSFLATMLYYADNIPTTKPREETGLKLNYFHFLNGNNDLLHFNYGINHALLNQLFDYQQDGEYVIKVVGVKFDDLNGTLGLNIRISRADANNYDDPQFEEAFEFSGFRKIDLSQPLTNVLSFSLLQSSLTKILHEDRDLQNLLKLHQNSPTEVNLIDQLNQGEHGPNKVFRLMRRIYRELGGVILDNEHGVYYNSYGHNLSLRSLGAIGRNSGIYPFYTNYPDRNLIDHISLTISPSASAQTQNVTLKFHVNLQVFVVDNYATIDNLYSSVDQKLVLPVSAQVALANVIKSN